MGTKVQEVVSKAKQLISERKYQEAVRACRRVLLSRPDEVPVRLLLGQALLALGRHDEVRIEMQALARKAPKVAAVHRMLGEALIRAGRLEEAAGALRVALKLDPNDDEARELFDECGEVDAPPSAATIDRWFEGERTALDEADEFGEATVESAENPLDPAPARAPKFGESSVQLDPAYEREASGELRLPRPLPPLSASPTRRPTPIGIDAPRASSPSAPPPAMPRAPAPVGRSSSPPPRYSSPPMALPPRPAGAPPPRATAKRTGTEEIDIGEVLPASGSDELDSMDLAPVFPEDPYEALGIGVAPLHGERTRGRDDRGTFDGESTRARPSSRASDPFEDLDEGLPPLEGEVTRGRPDQQGAFPALDDPVTRRGLRSPGVLPAPGSAPHDPDDYIPTQAVRVPESFPIDHIGGGLEPLDAEPTRLRPSPSSASLLTPDPMPIAPARTPDLREPSSESRSTESGKPSMRQRITERLPTVDKKIRESLEQVQRLPVAAVIALAGIPVLLLVMLVAVASWYFDGNAEEEIVSAVRAADQDGLVGSLAAAIELDRERGDNEPHSLARRARLYATAAIEHGLGDASAFASELLTSLEGEELSMPDARIASIYLELESGNLDRARGIAAALPTEEDAGEAAYARAVCGLRAGALEEAEPLAQMAQSRNGRSPRYNAILARVLAARGDQTAALGTLEELGGTPNPTVMLAKMEALLGKGEHTRADEVGAALLGDMLGMLSARQVAEARLLRAFAKLKGGNAAEAEALARAAEQRLPARDERLGMRLVRVYLGIDKTGDAVRVLEALPEESGYPDEKTTLAAEVYLAAGDLQKVEQVVRDAADTAELAFARGRLAEAKSELDAAARYYEAAESVERYRLPARLRRASLALRASPTSAIHLLEDLRPQVPGHAELVSMLVEAYLREQRVSDAQQAVDHALRTNPTDPDIKLAEARVELARGSFERAIRIFDELTRSRPMDYDLRANLGDAARQAHDYERAERAYDEALRIREGYKPALLGLLLLALDREDLGAAEEAFDRAKTARVDDGELRVAEARIRVMRGEGEAVVEDLKRIVEGQRDPRLWTALGLALLQAERDAEAISTLERSLRVDDDQVDAHLGIALAHIRRTGSVRRAQRNLDRAEALIERDRLGGRYEAQLLALEARASYVLGRLGTARDLANEAVRKDEKCAEAHLVLGLIATDSGESPLEHLRRALEGRRVPPEVLGQVALYTISPRERCEVARRYLEYAPGGVDSREVRERVGDCH